MDKNLITTISEVIKHLPGRHNQKTHAGSVTRAYDAWEGSGGEARASRVVETLKQMADVEGLPSYLKTSIGSTITDWEKLEEGERGPDEWLDEHMDLADAAGDSLRRVVKDYRVWSRQASPTKTKLKHSFPDKPADYEPDEIYNRPIKSDEYGVNAFNVKGDGRGEIHVTLPRGAGAALIDKLDNSLNSQGMITANKNKRSYWVSGPTVSQIKMDGAAKIIRRWQERDRYDL